MKNLQVAFDEIDRFAKQWSDDNGIPGLAIAITDREKPLKVFTYGWSDIANRIPVEAETRFEIGSLGKPFTSIALLQLHDEGKLDLHAPITDYLPWFDVQSSFGPITAHHLMNHTAGIVRGTDLAPHGLYEAWALHQTRASAPPGDYFSYSNIGYKIVGFLLERLSGQTLAEAIQDRVLDPLGMTDTYPVVAHASRRRTAVGYCGCFDDRPEHRSHDVVPAIWAEYATGDGCEVSTVHDMASYLRVLLNRGHGPAGRLISDTSFDLMTLNGIWTGGDFYGYGLATYPVEDTVYIGHGGGNAGFRSAIVVDLDAGLGVVCLLNRMGETDPVVEAAQYALTTVRQHQLHKCLPPRPVIADPTEVDNAPEFSGIYRAGSIALAIEARDGKLLLTFAGQTVALERRTADSFYVPHPALDRFLLDFKRIDGQVVEAFHGAEWYINGRYKGPLTIDHPEEWAPYAGHYRTRNPELSNFRIVLRKGVLALINPWGNTEPLIPLGGSMFRVGEDKLSPETLRFDAVVDGLALRADFSGCPYYRAYNP